MTGCPVCQGSDRSPLWWSKAGFTTYLCDVHKDDARAERRLRDDLLKGRKAIGLGPIRGVRWSP